MSTTLNDLIEHLTVCRDQQPWIGELPVLLAKDAEGNEYRPTDGDFDIISQYEHNINFGDPPFGSDAVIIWPAW